MSILILFILSTISIVDVGLIILFYPYTIQVGPSGTTQRPTSRTIRHYTKTTFDFFPPEIVLITLGKPQSPGYMSWKTNDSAMVLNPQRPDSESNQLQAPQVYSLNLNRNNLCNYFYITVWWTHILRTRGYIHKIKMRDVYKRQH